MGEAPAEATPWSGSRKVSLREIWRAFFIIGLTGFGGVGPVTRQQLVDVFRWMDEREFAAVLSLCKIMPGPNTVNIAVLSGDRFGGWKGTLVALCALLIAPLAIAAGLVTINSRIAALPAFSAAILGASAAAAGLVIGTAAKTAVRGKLSRARMAMVIVTCAASFLLHLPLPIVLTVLVPLSTLLNWCEQRRD